MNHDSMTFPSKESPPPILYKYRPFDENLVRWLDQPEVYFSSPRRFNDPRDIRLPVLFEVGTRKQLYNMALEKLKTYRPDLKRKERKRAAHSHARRAYLSRTDTAIRDAVRRDHFELMANSVGVLCLTEDPKNTLMWSHYADRHRGICIGYDTARLHRYLRQDYRTLLNQVNYFTESPQLNPYQLSDEQVFMTLLFSKSLSWRYENEWRVLWAENPDKSFQIGHDAITSVIFGAECSDVNKKMVLDLALKHGLVDRMNTAQFDDSESMVIRPAQSECSTLSSPT